FPLKLLKTNYIFRGYSPIKENVLCPWQLKTSLFQFYSQKNNTYYLHGFSTDNRRNSRKVMYFIFKKPLIGNFSIILSPIRIQSNFQPPPFLWLQAPNTSLLPEELLPLSAKALSQLH